MSRVAGPSSCLGLQQRAGDMANCRLRFDDCIHPTGLTQQTGASDWHASEREEEHAKGKVGGPQVGNVMSVVLARQLVCRPHCTV